MFTLNLQFRDPVSSAGSVEPGFMRKPRGWANRYKLFRKRWMHRTRIFLKYHFRRRPKTPVFILTSRRSGSNLLVSYLNSVPGVSFATEPLNPDMYYGLRQRFLSKRTVLRHIAHTINDAAGSISGMKLLYIRMKAHGLEVADLLSRFPNARFIMLYRRSLLRQYLSLKMAEKTDVWVSPPQAAGRPVDLKIRLDISDLWRFSADIRGFYESLANAPELRGRTALVEYESLAADPQGVFDRILFPFLKLPAQPVSTWMKKQNPDAWRDMISNPNEVPDYLEEVFSHSYSIDMPGENAALGFAESGAMMEAAT